jgi:hypothetical protein
LGRILLFGHSAVLAANVKEAARSNPILTDKRPAQLTA